MTSTQTPAPTTAERDLLALVEGEPGLSQRAMAAELGMSQPALNRLMGRLIKAGHLVRTGRGTYATPASAPTERTPRALPAAERRAEIVAWLRAEPIPPTRRELSRAFMCSDSVIGHDLDLLMAEGWVGIDPNASTWRNLYAIRQGETYADPLAARPRSTVLWTEYQPA